MYYIKVTKTSLYNLVLEKFQAMPWVNIPTRKMDTIFRKGMRRHAYFLKWYDGGYKYLVFLAPSDGVPHLYIERIDWMTGEELDKLVLTLSLDELKAAGMPGEKCV